MKSSWRIDEMSYKREFLQEEESTSKNAKRDPLGDSGENVLVVQQLRDQITKLSQEIAKRDQVILEKDKKVGREFFECSFNPPFSS